MKKSGKVEKSCFLDLWSSECTKWPQNQEAPSQTYTLPYCQMPSSNLIPWPKKVGDRLTDRQTDRQTERHSHTEGDNNCPLAHFVRGNYKYTWPKKWETDRQTDKQKDKQTNKQTEPIILYLPTSLGATIISLDIAHLILANTGNHNWLSQLSWNQLNLTDKSVRH